MSKKVNPGFWSLCPAEPFRVFFPIGLLIGISGVSLWPLYFTGIHKFYPGIMHGRMMIQGFFMAFAIGFLGTAFPRLSGAPSLGKAEVGWLGFLLLVVTGMQIGMRPRVADLLFLLLLTSFGGILLRRFQVRTESPPPSFILVPFGFANAIAGTSLLVAGTYFPGTLMLSFLGNSLLYQGFVLSLLLGVGGFLLPRFLGLPTRPEDVADNSLIPWIDRARLACVVGILIPATFIAEMSTGNLYAWGVLRGCIAGGYLFSCVPLLSSRVPWATIAQSIRLGFLLLLVGIFLPAVWPGQRIALLHSVFVGGYTIITLSVATRVVLGHSGGGNLVHQPLPFLTGTVTLLLIGGVLRVWGDFMSEARPAILSSASYLWMLAAAIWGWRMLPLVRVPDSES